MGFSHSPDFRIFWRVTLGEGGSKMPFPRLNKDWWAMFFGLFLAVVVKLGLVSRVPW